MKHNLAPNIPIPLSREKIENKISAEYSRYLGNKAVIERSEGLDGVALREADQTEVNFNHLLDHYPNGAPRDHVVQYADKPAMITDQEELVVPESIVLGD